MRIATLLYLIIICFNGNSQSPYFKNFTVQDNLPSSECYQVLQDKKGYIWIATDKGVARYDGSNFKSFTKEDGLPENCIIRMYEDPLGRIWVAGLTGKIAYFENNKFSCLSLNNQISKLIGSGIISSMAYYKNALWIGLYSSSCILKITIQKIPNSKKIKTKLENINKTRKYCSGYIFSFSNKEYMYGCAISSIDKSNFNYVLNGSQNILTKNYFTGYKACPNVRATQISNKKHMFYFDNQLITIYKKTGEILKKQQIDELLFYLFSDSKKGLWLGVEKGGLLYYPKGEIAKSKPYKFLKNRSVSGIIEDHEGGYWISTLDQGIYYLSDKNFMHITDMSSSKVHSVCASGKTLYAGLDNGKLIIANDYSFSERDLNYYNSKLVFSANILRKINVLNNGRLEIGGSKSFLQYNTVTDKITWLEFCNPFASKYVGPQGIVSFCSPSKNTYWMLAYRFLVYVKNPFGNKKIVVKDMMTRAYSICNDEKGIIWIGNSKGLYAFDGKKYTFEGDKSSVLSDRINDIQIRKNFIWNATKDNGVCIKKGKKLYYITRKNGLASNICQSLFLESEKIAWIATNKGVSKIMVEKWKPFIIKTKNYSIKNGLISNEVNQITKQGNVVYIATNSGITWFDEHKVKVNQVPPPIYITKIIINKKEKLIFDNYRLKYNQNNFSISFIGLTYKNIGNVEYKYRLLGLDSHWIETNFTRANFTTLPYGNYTFEVLAKNNDGFWSKASAKIYFDISPPFWHTWWFRILSGMILGGGVYFFVRYRIRKVEKTANEKARLYQQTIEKEMKFLSSQMNPHFTFNAMNSIQYYLMENEPEQAQKYLIKYSKLIRKVLENSMKKFINFEDEVEMLSLYMDIESLRFEIKFGYQIEISAEIEKLNLSIPPMIIQPYIENAIWHGLSNRKDQKGKINLSFALIEDKLKVIIEDNGVGRKKAREFRPESRKKESLGMMITQQRLRQLHSDSETEIIPLITDLVDENGIGCGTRIEIILPYFIVKLD